jgi:hypothetical protein
MEECKRKLEDNLTQAKMKRSKLSHPSRMEQEKAKLENIPTQTVAKYTPRFPAELELQILTAALIPAQPCVEFYFGNCYSPWACRSCSACTKFLKLRLAEDPPRRSSKPLLTPPKNLLSVCTTWREEALRYFFANNTFVFSTRPYGLPQPQMSDDDEIWKELRDPHATRLLDFIDRPDWRDQGSKLWRHNFSYPHASQIDRHRHSIRSLALVYPPHDGRATTSPEYSDWDWVLKIDWKSLPNLEILYLDMKGMEALRPWDHTNRLVLASIRECMDEMKCLRLKKLVLMNLVVAEEVKEEWGKLFVDALAPEGVVEVHVDESYIW